MALSTRVNPIRHCPGRPPHPYPGRLHTGFEMLFDGTSEKRAFGLRVYLSSYYTT
jgi:hypothetical protein